MKNKNIKPLLFVTFGILTLILASCGGQSQLDGDVARGGQLYDKWWEVLEVDVPAGDQPLWATQATNTRSGGDTWRCKECHGWDYKGKDGAYSSGSHFTGFVGVIQMDGREPGDILDILKGSTNPDHDFSSVMDEDALVDLALFLSQGLVDDNEFVTMDKSPVSGDPSTGATHFSLCANCHGFEGTAINFGDESEPEYLGTVAAGNPWEFLHKVRFGQPGVSIMPVGFNNNREKQEYVDLLAFVQGLPTQSLVTEGGRLYDKWWVAVGMDAPPEGDQPLWSTQDTNTRSGGDTWRCKECHGWDYLGSDGAYSSGSHFTGFPGLMEAQGMSSQDLIAWLDGTENPDHDFSAYLDELQFNMLVAFIQDGIVDRSPYINEDKSVNGDMEHGRALFNDKCIRCHGDDGKTINFGDADEPEFIGTVAVDNPWEALHKGSFGQPGVQMPAGLNFGWTLQDIADLIAYLQTLPTE